MLYYDIRFGKDMGVRLTPHRFRDWNFRASRGKFGPHRFVHAESELIQYIRQGWSIRMSNPQASCPPSLITPKSIQGWK
jgi:hypothetical protein